MFCGDLRHDIDALRELTFFCDFIMFIAFLYTGIATKKVVCFFYLLCSFCLFVDIMRGRIISVEGGRVMNGKKELGIVICSGSVLQVDHVTFRV